ncbi:MAG: GNAT family N-acetyltransferase [Acetobacteraceae bacterium]|nr:GNAT family N-acetyltransferase [Acetobacteraceae bacterium]
MERLFNEWETNVTRFDRDGEALLAAHMDDALVGIGGLTLDPVLTRALRLRRFYVRPSFRGHGIGRRLAEALLETPRRAGRAVMVNAARGSAPFWEALGFVSDRRDGHTHVFPCPRPTYHPDSIPGKFSRILR